MSFPSPVTVPFTAFLCGETPWIVSNIFFFSLKSYLVSFLLPLYWNCFLSRLSHCSSQRSILASGQFDFTFQQLMQEFISSFLKKCLHMTSRIPNFKLFWFSSTSPVSFSGYFALPFSPSDLSMSAHCRTWCGRLLASFCTQFLGYLIYCHTFKCHQKANNSWIYLSKPDLSP